MLLATKVVDGVTGDRGENAYRRAVHSIRHPASAQLRGQMTRQVLPANYAHGTVDGIAPILGAIAGGQAGRDPRPGPRTPLHTELDNQPPPLAPPHQPANVPKHTSGSAEQPAQLRRGIGGLCGETKGVGSSGSRRKAQRDKGERGGRGDGYTDLEVDLMNLIIDLLDVVG